MSVDGFEPCLRPQMPRQLPVPMQVSWLFIAGCCEGTKNQNWMTSFAGGVAGTKRFATTSLRFECKMLRQHQTLGKLCGKLYTINLQQNNHLCHLAALISLMVPFIPFGICQESEHPWLRPKFPRDTALLLQGRLLSWHLWCGDRIPGHPMTIDQWWPATFWCEQGIKVLAHRYHWIMIEY